MVALDVCLLINRAASTLAVAGPANSDICARVGSHTRLLCKLLVRMSVSAYLASCRSGCIGFRGCVGSHPRLLYKLLVRMSRVSVPCKLLVRLYGSHGRVGSHTRLFCKLLVRVYRASRCGQPPAASCKLLVVLACLASCWSECPVSAGLASCRSACTGSRGRVGSHTRLLCKL